MVRSSYIIILSGMGDDVPILGALVTLLKADGLLLFLMIILYISVVRSSCIINVSGMGDDVPIWGALVTLLKADGLLLFLIIFLYISVVRSSLYLVWEMTSQFWGLW